MTYFSQFDGAWVKISYLNFCVYVNCLLPKLISPLTVKFVCFLEKYSSFLRQFYQFKCSSVRLWYCDLYIYRRISWLVYFLSFFSWSWIVLEVCRRILLISYFLNGKHLNQALSLRSNFKLEWFVMANELCWIFDVCGLSGLIIEYYNRFRFEHM